MMPARAAAGARQDEGRGIGDTKLHPVQKAVHGARRFACGFLHARLHREDAEFLRPVAAAKGTPDRRAMRSARRCYGATAFPFFLFFLFFFFSSFFPLLSLSFFSSFFFFFFFLFFFFSFAAAALDGIFRAVAMHAQAASTATISPSRASKRRQVDGAAQIPPSIIRHEGQLDGLSALGAGACQDHRA